MSLHRILLRDLVIAALKSPDKHGNSRTLAGGNVVKWQTEPDGYDSYPIIHVRAPYEKKTSIGRNAAAFLTVATILIHVKAAAAMDDGVEESLETLNRQILEAVINDYDLTRQINQVESVETQMTLSPDGRVPTGELVMHLNLEYPEDVEDFKPPDTDPFEGIDLHIRLGEPQPGDSDAQDRRPEIIVRTDYPTEEC